MSELTSTKPYFLRAMYEWCVDNGLTPHLLVLVDEHTRVPQGYVKDGEIVLNINYSATKDLLIANDAVTFATRFNGASFDIYIPVEAVRGIFARENGQGMFFEAQAASESMDASVPDADAEDDGAGDSPATAPKTGKKPTLTVVK